VRIPTFSRHSSTDTADDERPTVVTGSPAGRRTETVSRPSEATTTRWVDNNSGEQTAEMPRVDQPAETRHADEAAGAERAGGRQTGTRRRVFDDAARRDIPPAATGPKPRASLLATLGLIGGVAAALLVLSGPLLPYGIGLAVLALILSVSGMHATGRRHVAGKTDALIGMVLALAAIVVGVLALTGSLSWLGTDMQPVTTLRQWLDAHTVARF
jgi:hypothetical protein